MTLENNSLTMALVEHVEPELVMSRFSVWPVAATNFIVAGTAESVVYIAGYPFTPRQAVIMLMVAYEGFKIDIAPTTRLERALDAFLPNDKELLRAPFMELFQMGVDRVSTKTANVLLSDAIQEIGKTISVVLDQAETIQIET